MANRTSFETEYVVKGDRDVTIDVTFGNGQFGTSVLRVDRKILNIGELDEFVVGRGSTLRGHALGLKSIVTDVNDKTNKVSVSYVIDGGAQPLAFGLEGEVENEGDSERYNVVINLK